MKKTYPVIFTQTDENILIEVPDLEILTEGKDIQDAIEMARDAIGVTIVSLVLQEALMKTLDVANKY